MTDKHSYEKRFNVLIGGWSQYVDTPEEVVALVTEDGAEELEFIAEGYADERYHQVPGQDGEIRELIRRTDRYLELEEVAAMVPSLTERAS